MAETHIINPLSYDSKPLDLAPDFSDDNEFGQPDYPELQDLALSLLGEGDEFGLGADASGGTPFTVAPITLELSELLADEGGALVLDAENPIEIHSAHAVVDQGVVQDHLLVSGEDVSGFGFVVFDHGPTLYYPAGLELAVTVGDPV